MVQQLTEVPSLRAIEELCRSNAPETTNLLLQVSTNRFPSKTQGNGPNDRTFETTGMLEFPQKPTWTAHQWQLSESRQRCKQHWASHTKRTVVLLTIGSQLEQLRLLPAPKTEREFWVHMNSLLRLESRQSRLLTAQSECLLQVVFEDQDQYATFWRWSKGCLVQKLLMKVQVIRLLSSLILLNFTDVAQCRGKLCSPF